MKHIKNFENKNKLSVGDYVVIQTDNDFFSVIYNDFLSNHICVVKEISGDYFYADFIFNEGDRDSLKIEFGYNQAFRMEQIKYHAKSLEYLRTKINADKYNL